MFLFCAVFGSKICYADASNTNLFNTILFWVGEPAWVTSAKWLYKNLVGFFDTKSGNGIEAWINLEEEAMDKFEADKELQAYVSSVKVSV
ncbi:bahd acyltransferase bia1 [Quercus suber]|uniref:Bahd acyltransferase bia1 n=1 Tax=Quercus suber TaxID=58331 RepID=A0AAW0IN62_QUESU